MNKNFILVLLFFAFFTINAKEKGMKVQKHRDRLRWGYDRVEVTIFENNDGDMVKLITCSDAGDMRCRDQNSVAPELDFDNPSQYTLAEMTEAQNVIDLGDSDIDNGITSGIRANTVQFIDMVSGAAYYRTFTYTWVNNTLGEIISVLDVSDKF